LIEIRPVRGIEEMLEVERLQQEVWAVVDREIVPALHFIPATAVGAILIGAFDGPRMIGFVYGFPGFEGGERIIHSDMLAVLPGYRDRGLGRRLKLAQRDAALAAGISRITWTFDPRQARNAHLNLNILGATADRYLRNYYGTTSSPLHSGGTDRLWVTWDLRDRKTYRPIASLALDASAGEFEAAFARGLLITAFDRQKGDYALSRPDA
jgi:predicted GNAT superfamily acetyltransferase